MFSVKSVHGERSNYGTYFVTFTSKAGERQTFYLTPEEMSDMLSGSTEGCATGNNAFIGRGLDWTRIDDSLYLRGFVGGRRIISHVCKTSDVRP